MLLFNQTSVNLWEVYELHFFQERVVEEVGTRKSFFRVLVEATRNKIFGLDGDFHEFRKFDLIF